MGWGVDYVGLDPDGVRALAGAFRQADHRCTAVADDGSRAALAARLDGWVDPARSATVADDCALMAATAVARLELAEQHRIGRRLSSVALEALLAERVGEVAPASPAPLVVRVDTYELSVQAAAGSIVSGHFRVTVQHLEDGSALVTIHSGVDRGIEVGVGAAGWITVDDHGTTTGLLAEVGAAAGNWQERTWQVPGRDVDLLVASVIADEVPGARRATRTIADGGDALVPEPVEDLFGWLAGHAGPIGRAELAALDATLAVAAYERPAPAHHLAGASAGAGAEVVGGYQGIDLGTEVAVEARVGVGATVDGDLLTTTHLGGSFAGSLAGAGLAGAAAVAVTRRDRPGDDDDLDVDIVISGEHTRRISVHYDLDELDEAQAALRILELVGDPQAALRAPEAVTRAVLAGDLTVTELEVDGTSASAGIDLGALAKLGLTVDIEHQVVTPAVPMVPISPGS